MDTILDNLFRAVESGAVAHLRTPDHSWVPLLPHELATAVESGLYADTDFRLE